MFVLAAPPAWAQGPTYTESASPAELQARASAQVALNKSRGLSGTDATLEDALGALNSGCFATLPDFEGSEAAFAANGFTRESSTGIRLADVRNMSASLQVIPLPDDDDYLETAICAVVYPSSDVDGGETLPEIAAFMSATHPEFRAQTQAVAWTRDEPDRFIILQPQPPQNGLAGLRLISTLKKPGGQYTRGMDENPN